MPGPRIKVAVAIVLYRSAAGGTFVLVGQRPPDVHLPCLWEFPGGKNEPGEDGPDCAAREVGEETAVRVAADRLLLREEADYPDRLVELSFYLCRYESGIPQPVQCQAVRWVDPDHLEAYRFPEANDRILRLVRELSKDLG